MLESRGTSVGVLGLGYVGLPLVVGAAEAGFNVVAYDISASVVDTLAAGRSHVEDVSDSAVRSLLDLGTRFTSSEEDLRGLDIFVICVPTPLRDKMPDLSAVESAAAIVGRSLSKGNLVVLESTTYPGTTSDVLGPLLQATSGLEPGFDFDLAFSPERIDPGNETYGLTNTPKVVGGTTTSATERAVDFYGKFVTTVHPVGSAAAAEMAKLLENTFRHVNIALVNEMAIFCRELGVDLHEAIDAAATKPFGFMPFRPGPGVGGHCIPIDPAYLSWKVRRLGYSFRFVDLAEEVNDRMPTYVVSRVTDALNSVKKSINGARILLVGVAYKANIGDLRESPAFPVARRLLARGAEVVWHDPHVGQFTVDGEELTRVDNLSWDEISATDLVVTLAAHECVDWKMLSDNCALLLDTRNVRSLDACENLFRL